MTLSVHTSNLQRRVVEVEKEDMIVSKSAIASTFWYTALPQILIPLILLVSSRLSD